MRKRRVGLVVLLGVLLLTLGAGVALTQEPTATAQLEDTDGNPVGDATFTQGPDGVAINVNLQPGQEAVTPGEHGIHIHETGDITPDLEAAGEHHNPTSAKHGLNNPEGWHLGDLPNIIVDENGGASYTRTVDWVALSGDENAILDSDGSTLVIHAQADDNETDPSGESGDRVAAGVIRASQTGELTTPATQTRESTTPAGKKDLPKSGGADVLLPATLGMVAILILGGGVLIKRLRRT